MAFIRSLAVVALVAGAVPAAAQDWKGQGRIEGKVVDPDGKPIAGATVRFELVGRGNTEVKTDKNGRWVLGGVAAGRWNVDIEAPGFKTQRTYLELASESARPAPAVTKMEKDVPQGPPPEVLAAVKAGDDAFKAGRYAEARVEYEKLLALKPELADTLHVQIARCYDQEENYPKELEHLKQAMALDPGNNELKLLSGQVAIKAGSIDEGLATLKAADDSTVKDPNVFFNVAAILLNKNRKEDALVYLTKSVTVDPNYADGYFQRAMVYYGDSKYAEAKADMEKFLQLAPTDSRAEMARQLLAQLPK